MNTKIHAGYIQITIKFVNENCLTHQKVTQIVWVIQLIFNPVTPFIVTTLKKYNFICE